MRLALAAPALLLASLACAGPASPRDAGSMGDGARLDAGTTDAAGVDAAIDGGAVDGAIGVDASGTDSGPPDPVGTISGDCGVLDEEILGASPSFFRSVFDFGALGWASSDAGRLSAGAQEILMEGTAGGSSGYSEAFAFEELARCEGAELVKSETEIVYDTSGPLTDMLVRIDGSPVGVSVTRAVTVTGMCMRADTYAASAATSLLMDKLGDILVSSANVSATDRWVKQILFVFADTAAGADAIRAAWDALDPSVRADTIVYIAVSEGMDAFVYFEDRC